MESDSRHNLQSFDNATAVPDKAVSAVRAFLANVSQAESEKRPENDAWSIGEIAHHLVLVTHRFSSLPDSLTTQVPNRFEYQSVLAVRKFTLPDISDAAKSGKGIAPDPVRPTAGGNINELAEQLCAAWERTRSAFTEIAEQDLSRFYYEHHRLGPLNLYETLEFHGYHAMKHLAQMERTLARVRMQQPKSLHGLS